MAYSRSRSRSRGRVSVSWPRAIVLLVIVLCLAIALSGLLFFLAGDLVCAFRGNCGPAGAQQSAPADSRVEFVSMDELAHCLEALPDSCDRYRSLGPSTVPVFVTDAIVVGVGALYADAGVGPPLHYAALGSPAAPQGPSLLCAHSVYSESSSVPRMGAPVVFSSVLRWSPGDARPSTVSRSGEPLCTIHYADGLRFP